MLVHSPTILLIEDDQAAASVMTQSLGSAASIWHAESAADARAVLRQSRPDLIVVDLTLPDVDGLVFCTQLKVEAPEVPFMVCSEATTAEKVLAFKLGAEDVVAKPYEVAELEARIEAILRRHAQHAASHGAVEVTNHSPQATAPVASPHLGRLRVDLARWRVLIDDRPLELTPTEFQLLVFMTRRPGEIISREELARGVWGNESMSRSRTIDAYVRRISAKLSGAGVPRILSIRGMGYQLAMPMVSAA